MSGYTTDDFLQPEIMLRLYANGAFPMADEAGSHKLVSSGYKNNNTPQTVTTYPTIFRKIMPFTGVYGNIRP